MGVRRHDCFHEPVVFIGGNILAVSEELLVKRKANYCLSVGYALKKERDLPSEGFREPEAAAAAA
jgi:hypothetical protein